MNTLFFISLIILSTLVLIFVGFEVANSFVIKVSPVKHYMNLVLFLYFIIVHLF